jgi:ribosomal protein S18 acetylase RimI-like enzyme
MFVCAAVDPECAHARLLVAELDAALAALEAQAVALGYREVWLSTRRVNLRALAFYRRSGFEAVENYGRYAGRDESICLGKRLVT